MFGYPVRPMFCSISLTNMLITLTKAYFSFYNQLRLKAAETCMNPNCTNDYAVKEISFKAYLRTKDPWISVFILLSASHGQSLLNDLKTKSQTLQLLKIRI